MTFHLSHILIIVPFGITVSTAALAQEILSPEVVKLKENYERGLEKLRDRYIDELDRRLSKAVMFREASEIVAITRERNRVLASTMTGKWHDLEDTIMYINPNGSLLHSNGATGMWVITDDSLLLTWSNGAKHVFPIVKAHDALKGTLIVSDQEIEVTLPRLE